MSKKNKSRSKTKTKQNKNNKSGEDDDTQLEIEDDQEDELMDLMEEYGDMDFEEENPMEHPKKSKGGVRQPSKTKSKKDSKITDKQSKSATSKSKSETEEIPKKGKGKGKGKGKSKSTSKKKKGRKKSTKALKIAITGKAKKLPIEEADDDVEIEWGDDDAEAPVDSAISNFERARLDEQMKYMERDRINISNELLYMKTDLTQKDKLLDEVKNDYEKLRSDFDSYKKRMRDEVKDKVKFASEKLILELLEVLDNFDRTNKLDVNTIDKEDIIKGIQIIHNQLMDSLKKDGLVTIEAKGEPFDPYIHDAVTTSETDDHPHNTVLEEIQKGYKYKNKVLRPTKVLVSKSDIVPEIPIKRKKEEKKTKKEPKKDKDKEKTKIKTKGKEKKKGKKKRHSDKKIDKDIKKKKSPSKKKKEKTTTDEIPKRIKPKHGDMKKIKKMKKK
jgi:molecular chaperone GrpE